MDGRLHANAGNTLLPISYHDGLIVSSSCYAGFAFISQNLSGQKVLKRCRIQIS